MVQWMQHALRHGGILAVKQSLTKLWIWNAFNELMAGTSFNRITVEMIIEKSGVAKSTFYRHFRDKYDVLNYNSTALADRLIGQQKCADWKEFLLCMSRSIARDIRYYGQAFRTFGQNAHSDFLFSYTFKFVEKCYLTHYNQEQLTGAARNAVVHYCHGCVGLLKDWLNDPEEQTPEQIAESFYQCMPHFLRDTWIYG
mgnify:FL=1